MLLDFQEIILYALIPAGAALLGTLFAYLFLPRPRLIAFFFHIAAGIILGAGTLEFLPYLIQKDEKISIIVSFLAGGMAMIFLHMLFFQLEKFSAVTMALAIAMAFLVDGMIIAVGFSLSHTTGVVLTLSLLLLILLLHFVVMHTISQRAWRRSLQLLTALFIAAMLPVGIWFGLYLLSLQPFTKLEVTAFTASLFLYLGFHELLRMARSPQEGWLHAFALFIGLLIPLILV